MQFTDFGLNKNILEALQDVGYSTPTPIQQKAIPIIIEGKDLVGCAQTGTGKTGAFAMPIIHEIHRIVGSPKKRKQIRTLILTPTRELAIQIAENFDLFAKYTAIKTQVIFGGVSQQPQVEALKNGVDVLVATPGRFLDLYKQNFINIDQLHQLVLDEADQMLDMGFIHDVRKIVKLCPSNRQTLLFSATMPLAIRELSDEFLNQPTYVSVDPVSSTADKITQKVFFVEKADKRKLLLHLLQEEKLSNVLVFTRTKHGADNVVKFLKKNNISSGAIHGDKSQNTRQRILEEFKNKELQVLVATDLASRGIDIDQLPYVVNFDIPNISETYVHRIGRTGRAGNEGAAWSFVGRDEKTYWRDIEKLIKLQVKEVKNHPFPWQEELALAEENAVKKDYRNVKKSAENTAKKTGGSRKSDGSKKNKKRWY